MKLFQKLLELFNSKHPFVDENSPSYQGHDRQVDGADEISEEFRKQVDNFIEKYRDALEALAKG